MTKSASLFFIFLASLFLFGCSTGPYGRFDFQVAIADMFESGEVIENHTYYYIGPDAQPDAIMALDNKYTLAPSLWKQTEMTSSQLLAWEQRIDNKYRIKNSYRGAVILDEEGNKLGFWYSHLDWTTIKRGEGNTVIIYTPDTTKNVFKDGSGVIFGTR